MGHALMENRNGLDRRRGDDARFGSCQALGGAGGDRTACRGPCDSLYSTRLTELDLPLDWTEQHKLLAS